MSEGLNKVMLLGNLGADPELRMTPSGQAVLNLRVATSETYLDKNKVRQERTEWHKVALWGKRGESLAKILSKGSRIFVEGSLRTTSYDKDGQKVYKTEINATNIILAGSAGGGGVRQQQRDSEPAPRGGSPGGGGYSDADYGGADDDQLPF